MNNEDAVSSHRISSHCRQQQKQSRSRSSRHLLREIDDSNVIVVADQQESRNDSLPGKYLSSGRPPMCRISSTSHHGNSHLCSLNRRSLLSRGSSLRLPRHRREDKSKKWSGHLYRSSNQSRSGSIDRRHRGKKETRSSKSCDRETVHDGQHDFTPPLDSRPTWASTFDESSPLNPQGHFRDHSGTMMVKIGAPRLKDQKTCWTTFVSVTVALHSAIRTSKKKDLLGQL
jgi:hypothetical protein